MRWLPTAFKLARRSAKRGLTRTVAMVAALALPLAAMAAVATAQRTAAPSQQQLLAELIGRAETLTVRIDFDETESVADVLREGHPAGDSLGAVTPEVLGDTSAANDDREMSVQLLGADLRNDLLEGRLRLTQGQLPATDDGTALSVAAADRLDVGVGDDVSVGDRRQRISGLVTSVRDTERRTAVMLPAPAAAMVDRLRALQDEDLRVGREQTQLAWYAADHEGADATPPGPEWRVETRQDAVQLLQEQRSGARDESGPLVLAAGALALAEITLIIWTVFVIVVARRRRDLAVLAAAGAPRSLLRRTVSLEGALVGFIASCIALIVGVTAGLLAAPTLAAARLQLSGPVRLPVAVLGMTALVGVVLPTIAARLASRRVDRNVMAALTERPTTGQTSRTRRWAPVVLIVTGLIAMGLAVAGQVPTFAAVAAVALTVAGGFKLVDVLPQLADRTRESLPATLATRLTGRSASRSAALATALASLIVLVGVALVGAGGLAAQAEANYRAPFPEGSAYAFMTRIPDSNTVDRIAAATGRDVAMLGVPAPPPPVDAAEEGLTFWGSYEVQIPDGTCNGSGASIPAACAALNGETARVLIVEPDELETVLDRQPTAQERRHVSDGGVLSLDERLMVDDSIELVAPDPDGDGEPLRATLDAVAAQEQSPYPDFPSALITRDALDEFDAVVQPTVAQMYVPSDPGTELTAEVEDRTRAILTADISSGYFDLRVERGSPAAAVVRRLTVLGGAFLSLVVLILVMVTVTLSMREIRPDLSTIAAVGAERQVRQRLGAHQAVLVAGIGSALGVLAVAATSPALLFALGAPVTAYPWIVLAAIVALCLLVAAAAGAAAARRVGTTLRRIR